MEKTDFVLYFCNYWNSSYICALRIESLTNIIVKKVYCGLVFSPIHIEGELAVMAASTDPVVVADNTEVSIERQSGFADDEISFDTWE